MKNSKKLSLDGLKVESFITSLKSIASQTVKGGTGAGSTYQCAVVLDKVFKKVEPILNGGGKKQEPEKEEPEECDTNEDTNAQCEGYWSGMPNCQGSDGYQLC